MIAFLPSSSTESLLQVVVFLVETGWSLRTYRPRGRSPDPRSRRGAGDALRGRPEALSQPEGQSRRPVNARRTPSPIISRPPVPPTNSSRRGERANQSLAVPAATAQVLSDSSAIATNTSPNTSSCSDTWPASGATNCGSTAAKNTADFGLVTPTTNPSSTIS